MGSTTSKTSIVEPVVELNKLNDSIYIFYGPADQTKETKAKFIFFHDIQWTGDEKAYVRTWMSRGSPGICWPKEWLSERYPDALILSACYDAGYGKESHTGNFHMDVLAENLWQDILPVCVTKCPVFLIGHGLGGLVIKAVIRAMQLKRDAISNRGSTCNDLKALDCFLGNVKGVCFYNTPFLGSKFVDSSYFPNKAPLLDTIKIFDMYTCNLNEYFRDWRNYRGCTATAIFAVRPANMPFWSGGPLLAWMKHQCILVDCLWRKKKVPLVVEAAARHDVDNFYTAAKSDHFSVCKPHKQEDSSFQRLIELIECGMLGRTDEPDAHIQDMDPIRRYWTEYVQDILNTLPNLGEDEDVKLDPLHLAQLGDFEDILGKLISGLKEAGFHETCDDGQWERGGRGSQR